MIYIYLVSIIIIQNVTEKFNVINIKILKFHCSAVVVMITMI